MTAPYKRVYEDDAVGQNRERIVGLENAPGGGSGIDFNKDNSTDAEGNPADFLEIVTNGVGDGVPGDPAISIHNAVTSGDGGITIANDNDDLFLIDQTGDGGITLENDGAGDLLIKSTGGPTHIDNFAEETRIGTSGTNKLLTFYVKDGDVHWLQGGSGGSEIMALIWNGSAYDLHLQSGTTIMFDL